MKTISVGYETWKEIQDIRTKNNKRSMEDTLRLLLKVYKGEDFKPEMGMDEAVKNLVEAYLRSSD